VLFLLWLCDRCCHGIWLQIFIVQNKVVLTPYPTCCGGILQVLVCLKLPISKLYTDILRLFRNSPLNGWLSAEANSGLAKQYNYYDLGIQHDFIKHGRHTFAGFLGISLANGTDQYLSAILWTEPTPAEPNGHPFHAEYDDRSGVYGGFVTGVRYDFSFAKSRFKIGPSFWGQILHKFFPVSNQLWG